MPVSIPDSAVCKDCRYRLTGLPRPVCPECGRDFDPDDPTSYDDLDRPRLLYPLVDPPRNWLRWLLAGVTLLILFQSSSPTWLARWYWFDFRGDVVHVGLSLLARTHALSVGALASAILIQHFARRILIRRGRRNGYKAPKYRMMNWLWAPVCIMLIASTVAYPWPLWIRFQISRPWMVNVAKQRLMLGHGTHDDQLCGFYYLDGVLVYPSGGVFLATSIGGRDQEMCYGFVYSDDGERMGNVSLGGNWWIAYRW